MTNDPLELYIARFQMSLTGMTLAIRQDIVDEIRAHVHERMCVSGMPIPEILERLGPPEDLAREYCTGALVTRHRPALAVVVLRGAAAWVVTAAHAVAIAIVAICGYGIALGFFVFGPAPQPCPGTHRRSGLRPTSMTLASAPIPHSTPGRSRKAGFSRSPSDSVSYS